ncbi:MAG: alpha/beta hydrolase [Hyphomicrobium sp.]|nr:alpha/beta hydrolase [Hyphomicrobium sp.]
MKTSEADILIVPGWSGSGPDHWQSRWERSLKTARRVEQEDWRNPDRDAWCARIVEAAAQSVRPVVLVGHSLGTIAIAHAGTKLARLPVRPVGAFLVAPADVDNASAWPVTDGETFNETAGKGFAPAPVATLPFPSVLVSSANDPYCTAARAQAMATAWGAAHLPSGDVGHINVASGHGPWPDGLLAFGMFLKRLA